MADTKSAALRGDHSPSSDEERVGDKRSSVVRTSHGEVLDDPDLNLSEAEIAAAEKKLLRKLDWKLIPWLTLLYLVSFLDRTNIGNAKVEGLTKSLHMTDGDYRAALSVFFVSYSVTEPLTNILLKIWTPRYFLTGTMLLWGICMTTMGLVHNKGGLIAVRFFLGLAEAGLFPGINYYLSCWYKRKELGIRAAIFFSAAAFAGSFGGLLAAAIAQMDGVGGKPGWAWIFILEGLATILIAIATYWMVHDFPDQARFLSNTERARVLKRLRSDGQASAEHEKINRTHVKAAYSDWKTYAFSIIYMGCDGALYAFSLFTPSIISAMGYKGTTSNLLSVPPYAIAGIVTITIGFLADRYQQRAIWNIGPGCVGVAGFIMLIASQNPNVKYAGLYLGALGIYPCIPNTITWGANNIEGVFKRGIVTGTLIGWGNLNGVVSSNIYRAQDAPKYYIGHGVVLAYLALFLVGGSTVTRILLQMENRKRRAGQRDHRIEGKRQEEIDQLGDQRPDFIYTL